MADVAEDGATESPAQRQARLRRERRNAKLQAGGSERLNKITSLSGRPAAAEAFAKTSPSSSPQPSVRAASTEPGTTQDADPEEVDITNMFQRPPMAEPTAEEQRALLHSMLQGGPPGMGVANGGFGGADAAQGAQANDPIMQMMQQMMGGAGAQGADGMPPNLANMFGQGIGAPQGQQADQSKRQDYPWRIAHAIFALILALYTATWSLTYKTPTSQQQREESFADGGATARFFWIFATAELILQSTRYFVERGKIPPGGIMSTLASFLPQPWAGYVQLVSRYRTIYTTIVSDAMVIVFVLGVVAWWEGAAVS